MQLLCVEEAEFRRERQSHDGLSTPRYPLTDAADFCNDHDVDIGFAFQFTGLLFAVLDPESLCRIGAHTFPGHWHRVCGHSHWKSAVVVESGLRHLKSCILDCQVIVFEEIHQQFGTLSADGTQVTRHEITRFFDGSASLREFFQNKLDSPVCIVLDGPRQQIPVRRPKRDIDLFALCVREQGIHAIESTVSDGQPEKRPSLFIRDIEDLDSELGDASAVRPKDQ